MNIQQKTILYFSLILNAIFLLVAIYFVLNNVESLNQKWIDKKGKATIVMFGDSHTARADWNMLLSRYDIKKSGYGGFTSEQLLFRIRQDVIQYQPQICFIQCGGNDINSDCFSNEKVIQNLSSIIDSLNANSIKPVLQSLFHRYGNPGYNEKVEVLNGLLQTLAFSKSVDYLDIDNFLIDEFGLKKDLTIDKIHLNEKGYGVWSDQIKNYYEEIAK